MSFDYDVLIVGSGSGVRDTRFSSLDKGLNRATRSLRPLRRALSRVREL